MYSNTTERTFTTITQFSDEEKQFYELVFNTYKNQGPNMSSAVSEYPN